MKPPSASILLAAIATAAHAVVAADSASIYSASMTASPGRPDDTSMSGPTRTVPSSPTRSDEAKDYYHTLDETHSWFARRPEYIPQDTRWQCATVNYTSYFLPPMPTGELLTSMARYAGSVIRATCTDSDIFYSCDDMDQAAVCAYSTAVPASLSSQYASLASAATAWVSQHSSDLQALPTDCPEHWEWEGQRAMIEFHTGSRWTNRTVKLAGCAADKHEKGGLRGDVSSEQGTILQVGSKDGHAVASSTSIAAANKRWGVYFS